MPFRSGVELDGFSAACKATDVERDVISVKNVKLVSAGGHDGEPLSWDIRAAQDQWGEWTKEPPGMMGLGTAYTTRKTKFLTGDYMAMIKDRRMAGPLIKSSEVMNRA